MRRTSVKSMLALAVAGATLWSAAPQALALSVPRPQPDIFFAKGYDEKKAAAILSVLQDKQFPYLGGLTSYWPPKWGTHLSYDGDTASLEKFVAALAKLKGIHLRVSFSRQIKLGSWETNYSQAEPDTLSVAINLNSKQIDLENLDLPEMGTS